jgi:hypothetical protein
MLDVHPPHAPTHTWRDFFLHIATICVGLLIAIALEQAVEAIHHRHEREALVQEMRAESERNIILLRTDIDRNLEKASWHRAVMNALQTTPPHDGIVTAVLPTHQPFLPQISPSRAVWSVARTNGKVALLSEREAEIYDRLDSEAEAESLSEDRRNIALTTLQGQVIRLNIRLDSGTTITLPAADVPALTQALADTIAAAEADAYRCAFYLGASSAVHDSVHDRDDFVPYLLQERQALEKRLAKQ